MPTSISAKAVSSVQIYNGNGYILVTLNDGLNPIVGATVSVNVKGIKIPKTGKDGKVKISTTGLVPKNYKVTVTYAGDVIHNKKTATVQFTIKKATPKFVAKAKTFKLADKTKKYVVVFKDNNNKAMKSKLVYIKVAGITYSAKTDAKGQATFKLTKLKKVGSFSAGLTFKGDTCYNKCSKAVKIVVKK